MDHRAVLPDALRAARGAARCSQLDLAHRLGSSQRHISAVETGRARPSRRLLLAWLAALETGLGTRNAVLLAAGYAPEYDDAPLDAPQVRWVTESLEHLLRSHDPAPALVVDSDWDVVMSNRGFGWLLGELAPGWSAGAEPLNLLELMTSRNGFLSRIVNLPEVAPTFLDQLRREAALNPALAQRVAAMAHGLQAAGTAAMRLRDASTSAPVLVTRYATTHGELGFASLFTTIGSPHHITLASLRLEHLVPADAHTRGVLERAHLVGEI